MEGLKKHLKNILNINWGNIMDTELLLCSMFLLLLFGSEGVLYYYSHKKYKKAKKKEWHYITSTKIGIGRNRMGSIQCERW